MSGPDWFALALLVVFVAVPSALTALAIAEEIREQRGACPQDVGEDPE